MTDLPAGVAEADVERAVDAIDMHEMSDGDPLGVLIANSYYVTSDAPHEVQAQTVAILRGVVITALTAALVGSVVVPREPSDAMWTAGINAREEDPSSIYHLYRAMIAAAVDGGA